MFLNFILFQHLYHISLIMYLLRFSKRNYYNWQFHLPIALILWQMELLKHSVGITVLSPAQAFKLSIFKSLGSFQDMPVKNIF